MKSLLILFALAPFFGFAQKLKVNEYDRFTKMRRVEVEPLRIYSSGQANVSLSYTASGPVLYLQLSGVGWGASAIDEGQQLIFLFSNDSTVSVNSTEVQTSEMNASFQPSFKHSYFVKLPDIKLMSEHEVVGIRKYGLGDHYDLKVTKDNAQKIQELSSLFLEELKIANIFRPVQDVNLSDVSKHIGDSVRLCGKVYNTRYFETTRNRPTVLDVNSSHVNQLNVIIYDQDRKNFPNSPESLYKNKDVCIIGVVESYNNIPQIVVRNADQIMVKPSTNLAEADKPAADTATASRQTTTPPVEPAYSRPSRSIERSASFPGGQEALLGFLRTNIVCPEDELRLGEKKVVVAKFLIQPDGTASDIEITKPGGANFDKEVIRVLKMMPRWEPQMTNGTPVTVSVTQPITFVRQETVARKKRG